MDNLLFPEEESEYKKCKFFVQQNVPFSILKSAGFFPKEMKFNEYVAITKMVLDNLGYKTIEEYIGNKPQIYPGMGFINGKFPDKVTNTGELKMGSGFHLSLARMDFDIVCSICGCNQTVSVSTSTYRANKKCRGCKRKISISVSKDNIIEVLER